MLTWKCNNPAGCNGVIYQIYRKVEATGEYTFVGGAGQRKFTDATPPSAPVLRDVPDPGLPLDARSATWRSSS